MNAPAAAGASLVVRSHPDCLLHRPPVGHPEAPARVERVLEALSEPADDRWWVDRASPLPPQGDTEGVLAWIHDREYIERFARAAGEGEAWIDVQDCAVSSGSYQAALAGAGLALATALDLVNGRVRRSFIAARPPSHNAQRGRASGYCFFNAVALAAEVVIRSWGAPVLIVDFDAFHGSGTQRCFYDRADVGYLSVHRWPWFPGTGSADEIGDGDGRGATRNIPLAAGADDDVYCTALENGLEEMATRIRPSALIVSAGFNALAGDPLGGMQVTENGFRRISRALVQAADGWSEGRIVSFLEGGFVPEGLARSTRVHVEELAVPAESSIELETRRKSKPNTGENLGH
jgi:acetoin utilization deacetylase AcuC-like enzyme